MRDEVSPLRRAFGQFAEAAADLEQYLEGDGRSLLTASVVRLERFTTSGDPRPASYALLKQAMTDMEGLSLSGDAAKSVWAFLLAYGKMLDAIDAQDG